MPYLKIQTNHPVAPEKSKVLLASASKLLAVQLGKPER